MNFDFLTLFVFVFGLVIPLGAVVYYAFSKDKKSLALDSIAYGFIAFFGAAIVVFIVYLAVNALVFSSFSFDADNADSGMSVAGALFALLIAVLYFALETFKIMTISKFKSGDNIKRFSGLGFSAGVVLAQNAIAFVALNIFSTDSEVTAGLALFTGIALLFTGTMYCLLSYAGEVAMEIGSHKGPLYGLSSVYYIFWLSLLLFYSSRTMIIIMGVFCFVLSVILSYVFIKRSKKEEKQW